ncbi:MAG: ice-binding family protein [Deltaproteobacteria bacterium]
MTLSSLAIGCGDSQAATPDSSTQPHADAANNPPNPGGAGPAPVALGTTSDPAAPGSYVLLAKTGITNVTGSLITGGQVGLSPAAASFITGFALIADAGNTYSTSVSVAAPGKVFASDYAVPTPSNLTTSVLAMQAAYSDAASRTNPDYLNLESGNLGGLTLAPGLYRWGTGVTIPTNVTISGGANDVWIFQISNDLDLSTGTTVLLAGGASAKNVFWQVAGATTIHANAHFEGIILDQTSITVQTNASMNGRALAQSLVAIDNNAITAP